MATIGQDLIRELQRLYNRPKITFEKGLMQTDDDSAIGFVSDMVNFEVSEGGAMNRRGGSVVLNYSPFLRENKWLFLKSFEICGANVLLGLNAKRELWGWLTEWPELDFHICRRSIQPEFLNWGTGTDYPAETTHACFTRGSRFWTLDDEKYIFIINDYGEAFRINKRGYFQINYYYNWGIESPAWNLATNLTATRVPIQAGDPDPLLAIYLDIKDATNRLPETFHLIEDRFKRTVPLTDSVRVAWRNECGVISKFSDPMPIADSKSVIVSALPAVTCRLADENEHPGITDERLYIDADFIKQTYDTADPDAVQDTDEGKLYVNPGGTENGAGYVNVSTGDITDVMANSVNVVTKKATILYIEKNIAHSDVNSSYPELQLPSRPGWYLILDPETDADMGGVATRNLLETDRFIKLENLRCFNLATTVSGAGVDLIAESAPIGDWVVNLLPPSDPVGNYYSTKIYRVGWPSQTSSAADVYAFQKIEFFDYYGTSPETRETAKIGCMDFYEALGSYKYAYPITPIPVKKALALPIQLNMFDSTSALIFADAKPIRQKFFIGNIFYADIKVYASGLDFVAADNAFVYRKGFWYNDNCIGLRHYFYNTYNTIGFGTLAKEPKITTIEASPITKLIKYNPSNFSDLSDIVAIIPGNNVLGGTDNATQVWMKNKQRFVVWNNDKIIAESQRGWYDSQAEYLDVIYDKEVTLGSYTTKVKPLGTETFRKLYMPICMPQYQSVFSYQYPLSEVQECITSPQFVAYNDKTVFVIQQGLLYSGSTNLMLTNYVEIPHTVTGMHEFYDGVVLLTDNGFFRVNHKLEKHLIPNSDNILLKHSAAGNGGVYIVDKKNRIFFVHMVYSQSGTPIPVVERVAPQMYNVEFGDISGIVYIKDTLYISTTYDVYGFKGNICSCKYNWDNDKIGTIGELNGDLVVHMAQGQSKFELFQVPTGMLGPGA